MLSDQGIAEIIPAITTKTGKLWASLDTFTIILYPYIKGQNGYSVKLSEQQWINFGATLKRIHALHIPYGIRERIRHETFKQQWSEILINTLMCLDDHTFHDPISAETASFMQANYDAIMDLVYCSEKLTHILQTQTLEFVLCHSDIHAGNILIDANDTFYIVDWDEPIFAPIERDLMYVGGAQGFIGYTAQEEESFFYHGYGNIEVNPYAMAYYRYERIVEDIAIESKQLLWSNDSIEDREQSLKYLKSNF